MDVNKVFSRLNGWQIALLLLVMYLLSSLELYILWNWLGVPHELTNPIGYFTAMLVTLVVFSVGALGRLILWLMSKFN